MSFNAMRLDGTGWLWDTLLDTASMLEFERNTHRQILNECTNEHDNFVC